MKLKLLIASLLVILASCTRVTPPSNDTVRPRILQNFTDTSDLEHVNGAVFYTTKDSSLVYSRMHSFYNVTDFLNKTSVIANAAMPKAGGTFTNNTWIQSTAANKELIAMNLSSSSTQNAPTTFGSAAYYLGLGHREWAGNSYRLIGFGFRYATGDHYPVVIGYKETSTSSSTYGDFSIWTRPVTTNTAPIERLRVTAAGAVKSYGSITTNEDVATKGYVDTMRLNYKIYNTTTVDLLTVPSNSFITNNANAASTYTLPPASGRVGYQYTIWKIGASVMTIQGGPIQDLGKSGTKIVSGTETNACLIIVCNGVNWVIVSKTGTWIAQ